MSSAIETCRSGARQRSRERSCGPKAPSRYASGSPSGTPSRSGLATPPTSTWACSERSAWASPRVCGHSSKPSSTSRRLRSWKPRCSAWVVLPSTPSTSAATRDPRDARRKLTQAGQRIVATDARYQRVEVRRGPYGWDLLVAPPPRRARARRAPPDSRHDARSRPRGCLGDTGRGWRMDSPGPRPARRRRAARSGHRVGHVRTCAACAAPSGLLLGACSFSF